MNNQRLQFLLDKLANQKTTLTEEKEIDEFYQSFDEQPDVTNSILNLKEYEQLNALRMSVAIDEKLALNNRSFKVKNWIGMAAALLVIAFGITITSIFNGDYKTVTTTNGETKQIQLPDGSQVTLNTMSTLKYAKDFNKEKARIIELSGEAYFKVKKNIKQPFIVNTVHQRIVVTGTRFNVNAYKDEEMTTTTLFEGSIQIFALSSINVYSKKQKQITLKPGQKVVLENGLFTFKETPVANALLWEKGVFCFDSESLRQIMNKVGRWYNAEVIYVDGFSKVEAYQEEFNGRISKSVKLEQILKVIGNVAAARFTVKGKKIFVKLTA